MHLFWLCNQYDREISLVFTLNNYVRKREFKVTIKFVAHANMHQLHELVSGKQVDTPQEALKVIDIVLKELASQRCVQLPLINFCCLFSTFFFFFLALSIYCGF